MQDKAGEFLDQRVKPLADSSYGTDEDDDIHMPAALSDGIAPRSKRNERLRGRPPGSGGRRVSRTTLGRARSMFRTASGDEPDHLVRFQLHFEKPTEIRENEALKVGSLLPTWEIRECQTKDKAGSAGS